MKITRMFIVTGFVAILGILIYYERYLVNSGGASILDLEFAGAAAGKSILKEWQAKGLLSLARTLTSVDFVFIFFYVAVIMTFSNRQIRKEPNVALNALLRANFFFAILAGLLDVIENINLLYDINNVNSSSHISVLWIAMLKFALIGITIMVWLISVVHKTLSR